MRFRGTRTILWLTIAISNHSRLTAMNLSRTRDASRPKAVIVTYNSAADIDRCVRELDGLAVAVIDNASTDNTREIVAGLVREGLVTTVIHNPDNLGFAAAVNIGLRAFPDGDILLLNPDARIDAANVAILSAVAADATVGIVAPVIDNGPGVAVLSAGEQPRLWPMLMHFSGTSRLFPRTRWLRGRHLYRAGLESAVQTTGWVSGGCLLFTERARLRVGELSERWFMYGEDVDLCRRVTEAGLEVVVARDAAASHAVGSSVNAAMGPVSTMWARSTLDYYRSTFHPRPVTLLLWRMTFSGGLAVRALAMQLRSLRSRSSREDLRARARRFRAQARALWARSSA